MEEDDTTIKDKTYTVHLNTGEKVTITFDNGKPNGEMMIYNLATNNLETIQLKDGEMCGLYRKYITKKSKKTLKIQRTYKNNICIL